MSATAEQADTIVPPTVTPPDYTYRGLDSDRLEIRLLILHPGTGDDQVDCSLEHVYLDRIPRPKYETISYCWGDAAQRDSIHLRDCMLNVPKSSADALRRTRVTKDHRSLWIDAICIDQTNLQERGRQVALMRDIYSSSTGNLIWLGPDDGHAVTACDSVHLIARSLEAKGLGFHASPLTVIDFMAGVNESLTPAIHEVQCDALEHLYSSPWFERIWIFQEAFLAPANTCYYGTIKIPFNDVLSAASWVARACESSKSSFPTPGFREKVRNTLSLSSAIRQQRSPSFEGFTVYDIYGLGDMRKAADPRDRIFGMLGMCLRYILRTFPALLQPDYSKAPANVFRDSTRASIELGGELLVIEEGSEGTWLTGETSPSWAVSRLHDVWNDPMPLPSQSSADDARRAGYVFSKDDPDLLSLQGVLITGLTGLVGSTTPETCVLHFLKQCEELVTAAPDVERRHAMHETLCRAIIAGEEDYVSGNIPAIYTAFKANIEHELPDGSSAFSVDDLVKRRTDLSTAANQRFAKALYSAVYRRAFFVTEDGRMGLGPAGSQAGDIIAAIYGMRFPFVLRPCGRDYRIVGPCYLHGIMSGEAVRERESQGLEPDWINLR